MRTKGNLRFIESLELMKEEQNIYNQDILYNLKWPYINLKWRIQGLVYKCAGAQGVLCFLLVIKIIKIVVYTRPQL